MLARRFLWVIAILTMIVIAAALGYGMFGNQLIRAALVPGVPFTPQGPAPDYADTSNWAAHPALARDAARWTPAGYAAAPRPGVAVFYVAPTAYVDRARWNAELGNPEVTTRVDNFLRAQASIFNGVAAVWAPRYRQATYGAFLTDKPEAGLAKDLAYADVLAAFDAFVSAQPADRPLILAGHSQGSFHLLRLLKDRVAGTALTDRVVAVYIPGWPISMTADMPALGLPACSIADETGCILAWQSFADPADYKAIRDAFDKGAGLTGALRLGTQMLCVNPIAGIVTAAASLPAANFGALVPTADFAGGSLRAKTIGAHCRATGILDIGPAPEGFNAFVLPGNNYHVYDFPLFWANLRADVERRVDRFSQPVKVPPRRRVRAAAA